MMISTFIRGMHGSLIKPYISYNNGKRERIYREQLWTMLTNQIVRDNYVEKLKRTDIIKYDQHFTVVYWILWSTPRYSWVSNSKIIFYDIPVKLTNSWGFGDDDHFADI